MSNKVPRPPKIPAFTIQPAGLWASLENARVAQINDDIEDAEYADTGQDFEEPMIKLTHVPVWTSADGKWAVVEATEDNVIPRYALRSLSFKEKAKAIAVDPGDYDRGIQKRGELHGGFAKVPANSLPELLTNEFGDISL